MTDFAKSIEDLSPKKQELFKRLLEQRKQGRGQLAQRIPRRPPSDSSVLSFSQQRLWLLDQLEPGTPAYNIYFTRRLLGPLNVSAFKRSLSAIVGRHQILRTTFAQDNGKPVQRIAPARPVLLPMIDLSALPEQRRESEAIRVANEEAKQPFDLSKDPMLRVRLLRLDDRDHAALMTMHHIASDGWSLGVFMRELSIFYKAFSASEHTAPPELPIQYADYADWQRQWLSGEVLEQQLSYWKRQLAGAPLVLDLPTDRPRPKVRSLRGASQPFVLSNELHEKLKALCRQEGATLFMVLLAAFQVLLYRYSDQEDLLVGSPVANRNWPETEGLIGFFVNTLVMRASLAGNPTFRHLLGSVRETALAAYQHQDLPFDRLVEALMPERNTSHTPLFQVMFALQNAQEEALQLPNLSVKPLAHTTEAEQFDLAVSIIEQEAQLKGSLEYSTDLFDAATVSRMLEHFQILLEGIVANPDDRVSDLPLLTRQERRLLAEWNDTGRAAFLTEKCTYELFEEQVKLTPHATAAVFEHERLTYDELNRRANQMAHYLQRFGVGPDVLVGVCLERSLDVMIGILGIWKAGGAYVPLDPAYPKHRLAMMLEDARIRVLLTRQQFIEGIAPCWENLICLSRDSESIAHESQENPSRNSTPQNIAYVIYTSGTTGRPKGVMVQHRSAANHMQWMTSEFPLTQSDRALQKYSIGFDASITEIFHPLISGAALVVVPPGRQYNIDYLVELIRQHQITALDMVPSMLKALVEDERIAGCASLRQIVCGAETLPVDLEQQVFGQLPQVELVNVYGPTEATITATYYCSKPGFQYRSVPVGKPIANTQVHILDKALRPVPVGVIGEIYIGGQAVALGYLNQAELTAEKFIPDAFGAEPGARLYRSGDLAHYLANGNIEFLGRADNQVKLRGFRIELGEIEAVLAAHPGVREAAVIVRQEESERKQLVAYLVAEAEATPNLDELRAYLKQKLPDYMVPSAMVVLDEMPLTANGKLDRKALPAPDLASRSGMGGEPLPLTMVEEVLIAIYEQVLQLEGVRPTDNFFELGGHSLLATQVVSRVREAFKVEVGLRSLFESPRLSELAAVIEQAMQRGQGLQRPAIERHHDRGEAALSYAQERLWFLDQLQPGSGYYNIPVALRLRGELDIAALKRTLSEVVRRHEVLRTSFASVEGRPVQRISESYAVRIAVVDVSELSEAKREAEARRLVKQEADTGFDLARGPLLRMRLVRLGPDEHVAVLTLHHIVSDGWSTGVLIKEVSALYAAYSQGEESPLAALPIQYADYAAWQRRWLSGEVLEQQLQYWRQQLAGAPAVLELPTDHPRPAVMSHRGGSVGTRLDAATSARLKQQCRQRGVTLFMNMLAGLAVVLWRYSGQQAIVVGTPIAGRNQAELEELIGFFVNTLALRVEVRGEASYREMLEEVREVTLGGYAHQELPFEKLVEEMAPARSLSHSPVFQVMLAVQNAPGGELKLGEARVGQMETGFEGAKFEMTVSVVERGGEIVVGLEYASDLFEGERMERLLEHLKRVLEEVSRDDEVRVSEIAMLSAAEQELQLNNWNHTARDYAGAATLHGLIEAQVARSPEAIAVISGDQQLSYTDLNAKANQLARTLRGLGVGPEVTVGICCHRSLEMVIGLFAILKAGGAYVPLDPDHPQQRLATIINEAGLRVVLAQNRCRELVTSAGLEVVNLDTDWAAISQQSAAALDVPVADANLAYVIYTSGSTGEPKGAMNSHAGIRNRLLWMQAEYGLTAEDVVLQKTPYSFDVSVWEFFWPLMVGAKLVMAEPGGHRDSQYLVELIAKAGVTTLHFVPAMLAVFIEEAGLERLASVKRVLCSGEALSRELVEKFHTRMNSELHNLYGPTEAAVDVSSWKCEPGSQQGKIAIGKPIGNLKLYILGEAQQLVPMGVAGELYIGGIGVGRGYLQRPELTAERFVPDPYGENGERLYKTGDVCRYWNDGNIEYLGRADNQVKVRGLRIELGEIETALREQEGVREAAVVVRTNGAGDQRLVGYVVRAEGSEIKVSRMKDGLKERLPEYMVPSALVVLDEMPLTANGKLDRKALPAPEPSNRVGQSGEPLPRTMAEEILIAIYEQVLQLEGVRPTDNFFELGGHSLLATQVISRVRDAFKVELALRRLFETPTVGELAAVIEQEIQQGEGLQRPPIERRRKGGGEVELSYAQERLWFLDQLQPDSGYYNIPVALRLRGELDRQALRRTLSEVVRRHEVLRTSFPTVAGRAVQRISEAAAVALPEVDLSELSEAEREAEARRLIKQEAEAGFDLAVGPLLRMRLVRLGEDEHVVLLTMHHIINDGWSTGVLVREVSALYEAYRRGEESALAELPIQYADYAAWQRGWLSGEVLEQELGYWRQQLAGAPAVLELPTERPRAAVQGLRGARESFPLPAELCDGLKQFSRRNGVTLFITMLAAFETLLYRHTGQKDIVLGTALANRNRATTEGLIGLFINMLILRIDLSGSPRFSEFLCRVRETVLDAYAHQDVPFDKLVEELRPERSLSHAPLVQVAFGIQNAPAQALSVQGITFTPVEFEHEVIRFDLTLWIEEDKNGLRAAWTYSTDLFDASTIKRLHGHYESLLTSILARPDARLDALKMLAESEEQQLIESAQWRLSSVERLRSTKRKSIRL